MPVLPTITAVKYWLDAGTISGVSNGSNIAAGDWVDQSQSALGALTAATAAKYRTGIINGLPVIEFDGSTSFATSPSFTLAKPRIFMAAKPLSSSSAYGRMIDGVTSNKAVIALGNDGFNNALTATAGDTFTGIRSLTVDPAQSLSSTHILPTVNKCQLLDAVFNGASSTFRVDENVIKTGTHSAVGYTDGVTLGSAGGQFSTWFANYQLAELIIADADTLSAGDAAVIRAYLIEKYAIVTSNFIYAVGDSLTAGVASGDLPEASYPFKLMTSLGSHWRSVNGGVPGETNADEMDDTSIHDLWAAQWTRGVMVIWLGCNDLNSLVGNLTGAQAYTDHRVFTDHCVSAGWRSGLNKIIVCTVADGGPFHIDGGGQDVQRQIYNDLIRAHYTEYADALVDLAADARYQDYGNTTYFQIDGLHHTEALNAVTASLVQAAIEALYADGTQFTAHWN